jgi:hypothetical protein
MLLHFLIYELFIQDKGKNKVSYPFFFIYKKGRKRKAPQRFLSAELFSMGSDSYASLNYYFTSTVTAVAAIEVVLSLGSVNTLNNNVPFLPLSATAVV